MLEGTRQLNSSSLHEERNWRLVQHWGQEKRKNNPDRKIWDSWTVFCWMGEGKSNETLLNHYLKLDWETCCQRVIQSAFRWHRLRDWTKSSLESLDETIESSVWVRRAEVSVVVQASLKVAVLILRCVDVRNVSHLPSRPLTFIQTCPLTHCSSLIAAKCQHTPH